ncbi:MAG: general secretion pathway protein GspK [Paracoccaceae bacterium]
MPKPPAPPRQRGLALIVVLWAAILLALIAGGVARLSRSDLNLARNLVESTRAELAADSALWTAVQMIVDGGPQAWPPDGTVYAWRFAGAEVRVRVTDELGRIDINAASPELLAALFVAAGAEPEEATELAEAVVAFRSQGAEEPEILRTGQPLGDPVAAFALTDGLAQVPGMPPALQNRIAEAITVYTGQARPRSGVTSPLVLAAIEGGVLAEAEPGDEADIPATGETPELGDRPAVLREADEPMRAFSGLLRIEAEAISAGGSHFAREAVIALERRRELSYHLRLWRRGARVLFPVPEQAR